MSAVIEFKKRAIRFETAAAHGRYWESKCGRYRVRESHIRGLATKFYAQVRNGEVWDIVSEHRERHTAADACEKHAKKNPQAEEVK